MADSSSIDYSSIPLIALNFSLRKELGLYLNPRNTVAADWATLAEMMGFSYIEIKNYEKYDNPTAKILEDWQSRCPKATVGNLVSMLEEAERKDVVTELASLIGEWQWCSNMDRKLYTAARRLTRLPITYPVDYPHDHDTW